MRQIDTHLEKTRQRRRPDALAAPRLTPDQLLEDGDPVAAATWHRILNAIERLQAKAPAEGEGVR